VSAAGRGALALRIDVDFAVGLCRAVPAMLDALARCGMRATFFVVAGRNDPRCSLARLSRRGYLRRLCRLGLPALARTLAPALLRGGEALLGSPASRAAVARIAGEGHEVAVHGHDHAWWVAHAWSSPEARLCEEVERGYRAFEPLAAGRGLAWGSPGWRTTGGVLRHLAARGVPYFAECWGHGPFRTLDERERVRTIPHLPITLPSLESLILEQGWDDERAVRAVLAARRPGRVEVLCLHDYFEGLLRPRLFSALLEAIHARGLATTTLATAARGLDPARLPTHRLTRGPVPGFVGDASWQGPAVSERRSGPVP
jgi:peptidoglycan/xylan/chitin deacetylase (PgdA/CDA1 family)